MKAEGLANDQSDGSDLSGLPAGHAWLEKTRWGIGWRLFVWTIVVAGLAAVLFSADALVQQDSPALAAQLGTWVAIAGLASLAACVASLVGGRLCRFFPFSQSLLFGGLMVAVWSILLGVIALMYRAVVACAPATECASSGEGAMVVALVSALPVFLVSVMSYGLALWCSNLGQRLVRSS
ncbi:hypothetical protein ICM05_08515 [Leucobacter sp. cx-42]|uniref:hypothetical protein n=1 Tax=unclassified Leucobacter TaxID=2621730 RepID=UPI00165E9E45|nr:MULTISPECIES: hypothetical protein [unclassified Leucobacter]MBC9954687.1 hypothetical protein [Leucobacter sp. cx-42]